MEPFVQTSEISLVRPPHYNTAPAAAEPISSQLTAQPVQNNLAGQLKQTEPVTGFPSQEPPSGPVKVAEHSFDEPMPNSL